ncbi:hypothetical protein B0T25DRAFT_245260 [Lasiosphaeria hispida]|uniref:Uncharacterized protein n=1 Tax=Lasiosphaeria hispida TaxID=260671 RepID=A0AAJ0MCS6_9PEZI|nr:hypothetical protein B0T25DRAFT_245260 [Lasiosphaeria hispida]
MPTATTISQWTLTNWGPLTTGFSADAACATTGISMLAPRSALGLGFSVDCAVATVGASCYPSGSQLDAAASTAFDRVGYFVMGYFSPGLVCPSGWKTVGVAARASDGSISASGIFIAPTSGQGAAVQTLPFFNPAVNAFTAAIDPGETAAACCPSAMTADPGGVCVSSLPDYRPSTACQRFVQDGDVSTFVTDITFLGARTTAQLLTFVGTRPITSTATITLPPSQTSELVGVSLMPMVMLVRHASDVSGPGAGGSGGDGGGGEGPGSPSKPNSSGPGPLGAARTGAQLAFLMCISAVLMGMLAT